MNRFGDRRAIASMLASLLLADADAPTPPAVAPRVPHPRPASIGIGEPALANAEGLGLWAYLSAMRWSAKNRCSKGGSALSDVTTRSPKHPPKWFVHTAWRVHRVLYRLSGGRFLWTTSNKRGWGALRLTTIGRRSGQERSVIIGYIEDGPNLVTLAMNGFDEGDPSWWLNLKADPNAVVRLAGQQPRPVRARSSAGQERDRLWQRWVSVDPNIEVHAGRRSTETPVIVLEPRDGNA